MQFKKVQVSQNLKVRFFLLLGLLVFTAYNYHVDANPTEIEKIELVVSSDIYHSDYNFSLNLDSNIDFFSPGFRAVESHRFLIDFHDRNSDLIVKNCSFSFLSYKQDVNSSLSSLATLQLYPNEASISLVSFL